MGGKSSEEMGGWLEMQHRCMADLTRPQTRDMEVSFHLHDGWLKLNNANTPKQMNKGAEFDSWSGGLSG